MKPTKTIILLSFLALAGAVYVAEGIKMLG